MALSTPYNVMVVDDSAVIRGLITRALETDADLHVVASVGDGQHAVSMLQKMPDTEVVVLDIEMPVMDGVTAIPKLLAVNPHVKIIMASTLTLRNAEISLQALDLGASDYIPKPTSTKEMSSADNFNRELVDKVKTLGSLARRAMQQQGAVAAATSAAKAKDPIKELPTAPRAGAGSGAASGATLVSVATTVRPATIAKPESHAGEVERKPLAERTLTERAVATKPVTAAPEKHTPLDLPDGPLTFRTGPIATPDVIAIGSSTGGPQALFEVLKHLKNLPQPIVITQHMPPTFTTILAQHISTQCGLPAAEGKEGDILQGGRVYIAPGDYHMLVSGTAAEARVTLNQNPPENFCRPAVDPMLRSLAAVYGRKVLLCILTGMGADGARGAQVLVEAGGATIAQDEATSVVWGMPAAVAKLGLCHAVLPLKDIGPWLREAALGHKARG